MPAVFTDEKADLDLQIADQTGIAFGTLMPNGDPVANNPNASTADQNIARRALGAFPAGLDYRTHTVGAMIVLAAPSTIPSFGRSGWFGIRNAVTNQYFWRLYWSTIYGGSNEPRMLFEYHLSNGALHTEVCHNPGFGNQIGAGTTGLWFLELAVSGSYGISLIGRQVNASGETVVINYSVAPIIYGPRTPDANEEVVMSLPCGPTGGGYGPGYIGKFALASQPFTFAERQALALSMFSV